MPPRKDPIAAVLGELARAFDALDTGWFVMGAQAAILHGVARATADVDVTVHLGAHGVRELVAALSKAGFLLRREGTSAFILRTRVVPLVHRATRIPVDLILAGPGLEELFLQRATHKRIGGHRIPVASVEDLAIMKLLANRPKDVEDVVSLLRIHRDADVKGIRKTLADLGALLEDDLTSRLETVLRRVRRGSRP